MGKRNDSFLHCSWKLGHLNYKENHYPIKSTLQIPNLIFILYIFILTNTKVAIARKLAPKRLKLVF